MESLAAYIPIDRRQAMAGGKDLPDRARGAALFVDISGFTPLTENLVQQLGLKQPPNRTVTDRQQAKKLGGEVGFPLVVRPSYVLGGRAMEIVHGEDDLAAYMDEATRERVLRQVLKARAGRGVIWALQNLENARLFERVLVMEGGRLTREGRFEEIAGPKAIEGKLAERV